MATINGYGIELTTAAGFSYEKYKNFIKTILQISRKKLKNLRQLNGYLKAVKII